MTLTAVLVLYGLSGSDRPGSVWGGSPGCGSHGRLGRRGLLGWGQGPEPDGRGPVVAGAGGLAGLLDRIAVVPGAPDRAGAAAVWAARVEPAGDLGVHDRQTPASRRQGESPPSRSRSGGRRSGPGEGNPVRVGVDGLGRLSDQLSQGANARSATPRSPAGRGRVAGSAAAGQPRPPPLCSWPNGLGATASAAPDAATRSPPGRTRIARH